MASAIIYLIGLIHWNNILFSTDYYSVYLLSQQMSITIILMRYEHMLLEIRKIFIQTQHLRYITMYVLWKKLLLHFKILIWAVAWPKSHPRTVNFCASELKSPIPTDTTAHPDTLKSLSKVGRNFCHSKYDEPKVERRSEENIYVNAKLFYFTWKV